MCQRIGAAVILTSAGSPLVLVSQSRACSIARASRLSSIGQVHEAAFDALELPREPRYRLAQLPQALALEARVIRHHPARPGTRLHERLGQRGPRIARPVGDPLVMHQATTALLRVHTELHRDLLPGPAPGPRNPRCAVR